MFSNDIIPFCFLILGVTIQFTKSTYNVYENKNPGVEIKVTSGQITSPVTIE